MKISLQTTNRGVFELGREFDETSLSIQDLNNKYGININIDDNGLVNIQNNGLLETNHNDFIYNLTINKNDDVLTKIDFIELYKKRTDTLFPSRTFQLNNDNVILLQFLHNSSNRRIIIKN